MPLHHDHDYACCYPDHAGPGHFSEAYREAQTRSDPAGQLLAAARERRAAEGERAIERVASAETLLIRALRILATLPEEQVGLLCLDIYDWTKWKP